MVSGTQKGVAWECPPEVRSEAEEVRGQSQLDSTQEERRVRKDGEGLGCSTNGPSGPNGTLTLN